RGPRRGQRVRPVQVQLDEVRAVLQLAYGRGHQLVGVAGLHRQPGWQHARHRDPGTRRPYVRPVTAPPPAVPDADADRALVAVVRAPGRADITRPADPG